MGRADRVLAMETTQSPSQGRVAGRFPATLRRVDGALGAAAAVAILGVGALAPATAQAAGVASGPRVPAPIVVPLADPAAIGAQAGTTTVSYRVRGAQLERV